VLAGEPELLGEGGTLVPTDGGGFGAADVQPASIGRASPTTSSAEAAGAAADRQSRPSSSLSLRSRRMVIVSGIVPDY